VKFLIHTTVLHMLFQGHFQRSDCLHTRRPLDFWIPIDGTARPSFSGHRSCRRSSCPMSSSTPLSPCSEPTYTNKTSCHRIEPVFHFPRSGHVGQISQCQGNNAHLFPRSSDRDDRRGGGLVSLECNLLAKPFRVINVKELPSADAAVTLFIFFPLHYVKDYRSSRPRSGLFNCSILTLGRNSNDKFCSSKRQDGIHHSLYFRPQSAAS
jgi:hypothetical protein